MINIRYLVILVCLYGAPSQAQDSYLYVTDNFGSGKYGLQSDYLQLAQTTMSDDKNDLIEDEQLQSSTSENDEEFKTRWFTSKKFHQYLGLGSLALATLTAVTPKEENGPHEYLARGAVFLGGAAMLTGFTFHYKDLSVKNFFKNPDNLHALLVSLGTIGYALAVSDAPAAHAGAGIGGLVFMLGGVKIVW